MKRTLSGTKRTLYGSSRRAGAAARAGAAVAATLGCVALATGTAQAEAGAAAAPVRLDYPLSGTTHLAGPDNDLALGPGTLKSSTDMATGALTAQTQLPDADGSFKALGIPVSVTTEFIEEEPTAGKLDLKTGSVTTSSHLTLRLKNLKVAGIPTPVGPNCKTKTPAVIDLKSEPGFSVFAGGKLSGTYTIPEFEHCLLATPVINSMVPGDGNTITLTLGKATQPPPSAAASAPAAQTAK
ncbi:MULTISPECIES: hypothetical protein [unclassified Streptomyces]|uniref:hypothetical protein n=1 Tax=unclassified Streptomyces TaxID=2593676 RepID=UPI002DDB4D94|nr:MULTISPECIES: hypothetical protein [unclassified Streptomyces]WSA91008.1 hypothetical protein OIE63_05235 [Streptomyces sp. NBC_01795]WSB75333.1 hypothetical protein OHB04_05775 [Streptomyces sp. NBC_01775]WSS16384.1 hypothetical protein OG533_34135 [Streptomyces sp. NBC_01186]WSS45202.1 hypothetical protein OG220_34810 [Streptomyces sp. NBC_01187]